MADEHRVKYYANTSWGRSEMLVHSDQEALGLLPMMQRHAGWIVMSIEKITKDNSETIYEADTSPGGDGSNLQAGKLVDRRTLGFL
jgi:hypothetical protein